MSNMQKPEFIMQTLRQNHFGPAFSDDLPAQITELEDGRYQVDDISGSVSVGQLVFNEVKGVLVAEKNGVWESNLRNGNKVTMEYDHSSNHTNAFKEKILDKDGNGSNASVMLDTGLVWRKEVDAEGNIVHEIKPVTLEEKFSENTALKDKAEIPASNASKMKNDL